MWQLSNIVVLQSILIAFDVIQICRDLTYVPRKILGRDLVGCMNPQAIIVREQAANYGL